MIARRLMASVLPVAAALALASPAAAAVTQTRLTLPATDPTYLLYDVSNPAGTTITGTSDGGVAPLDLRCDGATSVVLASKVRPAANGTWSVSISGKTLAKLGARVCYLHALPSGRVSNNHRAFAGVRLVVGNYGTLRVAAGPNAGAVYDYHVSAPQLTGRGDYQSAGSCSIGGSPPIAPDGVTFGGNAFGCAAMLPNTVVTRSAIRVDGADAFPPAAARTVIAGGANLPGLPAVTFTIAQDPVTGNVTVHELDPLVRCNPLPTAWPRSLATCSSFVSVGVTLDRTITQDHDGRLTTVIDEWRSTDGRPHGVDVFYQNGFAGPATAFNFPWAGQAGVYSVFSPNFMVAPPSSAPGAFTVRTSATAVDGDVRHPQASLVFGRVPTVVRFRGPQVVWLQYLPTISAGGSSRLAFAYARAASAADTAALAGAGVAGLTPPPCLVPRVLKLSLTDAKTHLHGVGCTVAKVIHQWSRKTAKGHVKAQAPKAGSTVPYPGRVVLIVSKGVRKHR